jgi:hypothetical protein
VGFYAQQLVDDVPLRCFTTSLSASGLFVEQPLTAMDRCSNTVQVEIPLVGSSDTLWTRGEVVYDRFGPLFHGTAIRFTAMAQKHRRMLRSWLHEAARSTFPVGEVIQAAPGIEILRPPRFL